MENFAFNLHKIFYPIKSLILITKCIIFYERCKENWDVDKALGSKNLAFNYPALNYHICYDPAFNRPLSTPNEASRANLNVDKRILKSPLFLNKVYYLVFLYLALVYPAFNFSAFNYPTFNYPTFNHHTVNDNTYSYLHFITSHLFTLHLIAIHSITLHLITLQLITLHLIKLPCI